MASRVLIAGIGGVGGALARRLIARGIPVHLLSRSNDKLSALSKELGGVPFTSVDVTSTDALEAAVRDIAAQGPLHALVYAVGSIPLKPLRTTTARDFSDAFAVNFLGAALAVKAAASALSAGGVTRPGSVVLFSTVAAKVGFPQHAAIAAAKGAVEAFARAAAAELSPLVRVNVVAPSLSDTPLAARFTANEATKKAMGDAHPLPRLGTADDSAAMADFLIDHVQSSWITGQVFNIDGGRSTLRPKN